MRRLGSPLVLLSIALLAVALVFVLAGNVVSNFAYTQQHLTARLRPPIWMEGADPRFLLGTDRLGRDLVARLIEGLRMSVAVALVGTAIGAVFGIVLGFVAAHFRGWVEEAIMAIVDVQASLPFILIALTLLAFFGNSFTLFVILMGLYGWEGYARLTRGVVLQATSQPYARAVVSLGASPWRLYWKHILPNVAAPLVVQLTINVPQIILLESALSFLGLGIQAPQTSLGQVLGDGRDFIVNAWWIAVWPGLIIFTLTLALSILGDAARDHLDPTLKGRRS